MTGKCSSGFEKDHVKLRACIMKTLYDLFKDFPFASFELNNIEEKCGTNCRELNWNIVYLEKCGFLELGKSVENPPYVASSVTITAAGIDLVENEAEFIKHFSSD